ncbi:MAG: winged helix family transcriptional regulator, partial [Chloroflexia bacterium]|nr:winged helix family transcriptional regulator [Chloroflexia bacterium]
PAPSDQLAYLEHELTPIDRKLWNYLQQHPDQICTREELLEHVWGAEETSARGLEAAIYRIRAKLHEVGVGNWEYIQTSRGQGYKFVPHHPLIQKQVPST